LADLVNEEEVAELDRRFGPAARRHLAVEVGPKTFDDWVRAVVTKERRGEVVLAIQRPDGQVLLHTKSFYPEETYRLPSGGIHPGEAVLSGVTREVHEETGLDVTVERFLGLITYELRDADRRLPFASYVFLVSADDQPPVLQDSKERISGFRYVPPQAMRQTAAALRALPDRWAGWGCLRAPPHDLVAAAVDPDPQAAYD
jgi:8-oxo-dGTP pyrophosphatase MutT (NUDIX family)